MQCLYLRIILLRSKIGNVMAHGMLPMRMQLISRQTLKFQFVGDCRRRRAPVCIKALAVIRLVALAASAADSNKTCIDLPNYISL